MANLKSSCDPVLPAKYCIINTLIFSQFFKDLNFTNPSNLQNLQNLSIEKTNYTVGGYNLLILMVTLLCLGHMGCMLFLVTMTIDIQEEENQ